MFDKKRIILNFSGSLILLVCATRANRYFKVTNLISSFLLNDPFCFYTLFHCLYQLLKKYLCKIWFTS